MTPTSKKHLWKAPALAASASLIISPMMAIPAFAAETTSIAAIQGTGAASPLVNQTVTTRGVVTAVYNQGDLRGYFIQTQGTGTAGTTEGASDAIFIYSPNTVAQVSHGQFVEVTGTVSEYFGQTQITVNSAAQLFVLAEPFSPVTPLAIPLPEDETQREALEGMLLQPNGPITVTDNYNTNRYGEIGLVNGTQPLRTATDVVAPGEAALAYEAENAAKAFVLDDGATTDYTRSNKDTPLPYLSASDPLRVGAQVTFNNPVVLSYSHQMWRLQPTSRVTGDTDPAALPASWSNTRYEAPILGSRQTASSFNVLNYFTTVGDTVAGCKFFTDRENNPITVSGSCAVRGAATLASFERQESKIVKAINKINTSVLSLEEIENSLATGGTDRDAALNALVAALNEDAGYEKWAAVPSPSQLPASEDVIRTAFIYQPAQVRTVGESVIYDDPAFSNARQPLAQAFAPVNSQEDHGSEVFVAIVNHFKSKGSGSGENADQNDGQGASNASRVAQAAALVDFAHGQRESVATDNVMLLGDFNSYTEEDPMKVLYEAGYTNLGKKFGAGNTYLFDGRVGSIDHILTSPELTEKVESAQVWNINSVEPVAHEYSRYNYNITNLYEENEFRSSDHDPLLVGMNMYPHDAIMFTDLSEGDPFHQEIEWMAQQGITTGWIEEDGTRTFRPKEGIQRDAMAAFFYRLAGSPDVQLPSQPSFSDVPTTHPFYKEIEWMKTEGLANGWSDGTFRPSSEITREATAAFFYRYAGSPDYQVPAHSGFSDISPSHYFYKEITWLHSTGITNGWVEADSSKTYRPYTSVSREATAAFIYRYSHEVEKKN